MRPVFVRPLLLAALLVAGCRSETPEAPAADTTAATPAPAAASSGDTFEIVGTDEMRFSLTAFSVAAGDTITVTVRNGGALPKETFGHNFVLLQQGADVDAFLTAAIEAKATEHIPADRQADVIAHSKLLGPGESDTVTFTAPTTPGEYTFVCSFPGHGSMMRGTMTVTAAGDASTE